MKSCFGSGSYFNNAKTLLSLSSGIPVTFSLPTLRFPLRLFELFPLLSRAVTKEGWLDHCASST